MVSATAKRTGEARKTERGTAAATAQPRDEATWTAERTAMAKARQSESALEPEWERLLAAVSEWLSGPATERR